MFSKRIFGLLILCLCLNTYTHAQPLVEKTIILQRPVASRNSPKYFDSIAPVFLSINGKAHDTVYITINHNKAERRLILNNIGHDTLMVPYGNDVTSLYYVGNPIPNNVYWGDTAIFCRSITFRSRHDLTIKSFSKGDATYDTANYWTNDVVMPDLSHLAMFGITIKTKDSYNRHQSHPSYTAFSVKIYGPEYYHPGSFICAVAQEDSTLIEVLPTKDLVTGELKGVKYTYLLNKGEYYYANGDGGNSEIVGTSIRSLNCKPLAVFTGTGAGQREMLWKLKKGYSVKPYLEGAPEGSHSFLFSEIPPDQAYSRQYVVPVFSGNEEAGNLGAMSSVWVPYHTVVQVVALFDNTKVKVNKRPITLLKKGDTDGDTLQTSGFIEADKPVAVRTYVGGIRGPHHVAVQAFPFDEISTDTMRIACLFHKDSITKPRKWKKPIAWVLARGDANSAIVYVNGRKKVFTSRANKIPGNFYFDTLLLEGNRVNWIQAPQGAYVQYAQELMGTGSQNVSTEGAVYRTKWLQARLNNTIVTPAQGIQQVCQNTPVKLEMVTDWYTAKAAEWKIQGQRDSGSSITHIFKDTGLHSILLRTKRPYADCEQKDIWDTTQFQVYVYAIPKIKAFEDTMVCSGSELRFVASYTDRYRPQWWLNNSILCAGCDSVNFSLDSTSVMVLQIQKPGCSVVGDTFRIDTYDTAVLDINGPETACYGEPLTYYNRAGIHYKLDSILWSGGYLGDTLAMVGKQDQLVIARGSDGCYGTVLYDTVILDVAPPLQLTLLSDTNVCMGVRYQPTSLVTGGDTTHSQFIEWNGSVVVPDFVVTKDTVLQCVVSDGCSIPDTAYQQVHVKRKPSITLGTLPQQWCYGQSVTFDISATEKPSRIAWRQGADSVVWSNLQGIQYSRAIRTNTPIIIRAANHCGISDTVVYPAIPTNLKLQLATTNKVVCRAQDTIRGSIAGGNGPILLTIHGSKIDSLQVQNDFEYVNTPTDSTILLVASDGCNKPDSVLLQRKLGSELQLIKPSKLYACSSADALLTLETKGGLPVKKHWMLETEGNTSSDSILRFTPKANHMLRVSVTDGCDVVKDSIEVLVSPQVTYRVSLDTTVCAPYRFELRSNALAQAGVFEMDFGNGKKENYTLASGETLDIVMDYKASGIYNWQLQQQHGNQSCKEVAGRIVVQPNPTAGFVFTPQIIDINTPEVRFIYTGSGASKINWESGNGVKGSGQEMKTRYIDTGYYVAKQVVENAADCRDSISAQIYVSGLLMVYMPTAIVPSGVNNRYLPLVYNGTLQEMEIYNRWGEMVYRGTASWEPEIGLGEVFICIARVVDRHGRSHKFTESFTVLH
jgi:hypothetical protein